MPLPDNWEHIVLDRKLIHKLHERGIQYVQNPVRAARAAEE